MVVQGKFKTDDRVKSWFRDRWWSGTVAAFRPRSIKVERWRFEITGGREAGFKILVDDGQHIIYEHPRMILMDVKTDEKVDDEPDALFEGYGLTGPPDGPFTIFEDEAEPDTSDSIFWGR